MTIKYFFLETKMTNNAYRSTLKLKSLLFWIYEIYGAVSTNKDLLKWKISRKSEHKIKILPAII